MDTAEFLAAQKNIDPNILSHNGSKFTPLHFVCNYKVKNQTPLARINTMIALLLAAKADPNAKTELHSTPLQLLTYRLQSPEAIELLIMASM